MASEVRVEMSGGWRETLAAEAVPLVRARIAEPIAAAMRKNIPISPIGPDEDGSDGRPAGYARDHIIVEQGVSGAGVHFDVGTTAHTADGFPYPAVLEFGSRPHDITAHGDYPLRDKHGHVFGRTVHHPGTPEYAWARRSIAAVIGAAV
jgi:hypothetical protein